METTRLWQRLWRATQRLSNDYDEKFGGGWRLSTMPAESRKGVCSCLLQHRHFRSRKGFCGKLRCIKGDRHK